MFKLCKKCKNKFIPKKYHPSQKFCSEKCFNEYRKVYHKNRQKRLRKELQEYGKHYYITHKKEISKRIKNYAFNHKQQRNERRKIKKLNNLNYKIIENLRNRMWYALNGICKSKTTIKLLGCSVKFLRLHLEKQFTSGMSWENYGYYGWHVDHIVPCASFDLTKPSQQRKCFHYTNLQPLWAKDNLEKRDKSYE